MIKQWNRLHRRAFKNRNTPKNRSRPAQHGRTASVVLNDHELRLPRGLRYVVKSDEEKVLDVGRIGEG